MITDAVEMTGTAGMRLAPAGIRWNAVKVSRCLAVQAIERIAKPGAVAVDPHHADPVLYFFVPLYSSGEWDVPHTRLLSRNAHLVLPPDDKNTPPGPYWLIPPHYGLTNSFALRRALKHVTGPMTAAEPVDGGHLATP